MANADPKVIIDLDELELAEILAVYSEMNSFSDCGSDYEDDDEPTSDYDPEKLHLQFLKTQNEELRKEIMLTEMKRDSLYKSVQGLKQMEANKSK